MKQLKKNFFWIALLGILVKPAFATDLSPYSTRELEQLEKEFVQQINQSENVERNPLANQYINQIGKSLARAGRINPPDFFIVKSNEINAFAGPGGHIGINSQLILTTSSESELAGVMAHELAHVRLHHLYSMIEHQKQMRIPMLASLLASAALGLINPTVGMAGMMGSLSGFNQDTINFTRAKEKEADRIGINMLIKAGFNPHSMAAFFQKMQENSRYYYTANSPAILRTHPLDGERIAEAENRTAQFAHQLHPNSLDYLLVKELIRTSVQQNANTLIDYYEHQCIKNTPNYVCQYGHALTLIRTNNYAKAAEMLRTLMAQNNNPYIQITLAQSESGLAQHLTALTRLATLHTDHADNYAVLMAYAQGLLAANQYEKAASILLKGSRKYKQDLPLCHDLARAQAKSQHQGYAYFTQAQCLLLEGQKRAAIAQLKVAQGFAQKDPYLLARISAKIDEIKIMFR